MDTDLQVDRDCEGLSPLLPAHVAAMLAGCMLLHLCLCQKHHELALHAHRVLTHVVLMPKVLCSMPQAHFNPQASAYNGAAGCSAQQTNTKGSFDQDLTCCMKGLTMLARSKPGSCGCSNAQIPASKQLLWLVAQLSTRVGGAMDLSQASWMNSTASYCTLESCSQHLPGVASVHC